MIKCAQVGHWLALDTSPVEYTLILDTPKRGPNSWIDPILNHGFKIFQGAQFIFQTGYFRMFKTMLNHHLCNHTHIWNVYLNISAFRRSLYVKGKQKMHCAQMFVGLNNSRHTNTEGINGLTYPSSVKHNAKKYVSDGYVLQQPSPQWCNCMTLVAKILPSPGIIYMKFQKKLRVLVALNSSQKSSVKISK